MKHTKLYSLVLASAAALSACNSGSSNTTPTTSSPNLTNSWNQSIQQQGDTCINQAVKADSKGNTYVTGSCTDSYGIKISHLTKYDAQGKELFHKTQTMNTVNPDPTIRYASVTGMTIDKNNDVYVASYANVEDVVPTTYNTPQIDGSIYKYDANGIELWHVTFGNNDYQTKAEAITTDNDGNPIIVGNMKRRDATISGTTPYFITKLNKRNGNQIFYSAQGPIDGISTATGVVVNNNNEIFIAGQTNKSFSSSSTENTPEYLVAKYIGNNVQWIKQQGTTNKIGQVTTDNTIIDTDGENVYIKGVVYGNLFATSAVSAESPNYYIAKYTPSGDLAWGVQNRSANQDYYRSGMSIDKNSSIIYTTSKTINSNNTNANVNAFSTNNGSLLWEQSINNNGNGETTPYAIYVSDGLLYTAGKSNNTAFGINNSISNQGGYTTVFTITN